MQSKDTLKLHGALTLTLRRADGSVEVRHKDNMIVNVGFDFIADAIGKAAGRPNVMSHIGVGTGTTAVAAGNDALVAEIEGGRRAATYSHVAGSKVFTFTADYPPGVATGAITEAGVFNAASAGIMLDRVVFAVINKGADDTFEATFTITMT